MLRPGIVGRRRFMVILPRCILSITPPPHPQSSDRLIPDVLCARVYGRMNAAMHDMSSQFTPQGTWAWSVKTRHAPARHCTYAKIYGHTTAAMRDMSTFPPPLSLSPCLRLCVSVSVCLSSSAYVCQSAGLLPSDPEKLDSPDSRSKGCFADDNKIRTQQRARGRKQRETGTWSRRYRPPCRNKSDQERQNATAENTERKKNKIRKCEDNKFKMHKNIQRKPKPQQPFLMALTGV